MNRLKNVCEFVCLFVFKLRSHTVFRKRAHEETSTYLLLGAQDQRLGAEQDQLPCGSTGASSGNCQETVSYTHLTLPTNAEV